MTSIKAANYFIHFKENAYGKLAKIIAKHNYSSVFVLVDNNSAKHCYKRFKHLLSIDKAVKKIEITAGEAYKNTQTCVEVWTALTKLGADRSSLLIALGGGVITDLAGFVAATFKRGIDFVNIPTTLLGMVDASVGGKTGVDLGVLKNQIGVFANPIMVVIDPEYLHTLSDIEFWSGMAEVIKYAMTHDRTMFDEILNNPKPNIESLIYRSVKIKNQVVLQDPKELNIRKVLNWGHTVGHAVESYFLESKNKDNLTHGQAIAIGMVCEAYLSYKSLGFPFEYVVDIKKSIKAIYGKALLVDEDFAFIIKLMKHDKKNIEGKINFVLLNNYESFKIDCQVDKGLINESLAFYIS
ncbi:MAG: 3-dehydroquinate synthase [Tenacibaculum sp.]